LHWEHLRQKKIPIMGVNHKQWWQMIKAKRRARAQALPLKNAQEQAYYWVLDDKLVKKLMALEHFFHAKLQPLFAQLSFSAPFMNEAIATQLLAGATFEPYKAYEILATGSPITSPESVAINTWEALQSLAQATEQDCNPTLIQTLHQQLFPDASTCWRETDTVAPYHCDGVDVPLPFLPAARIHEQQMALCDFINQPDNHYSGFIQPLIKAILLQFFMIQQQPLSHGNARLGRMLFYWYLLKQGYAAMVAISISERIFAEPASYYEALLYVDTDEGDVTYFIMHQLDLLYNACVEYYAQQQKRLSAQDTMEPQDIIAKLNPRQRTLLQEMRKQPQWLYRLAAYKQRFGVTYETSRTDLRGLAKHKLAVKKKIGKAFVYCSVT
jgi:Fic family protein